MKRRALYAPFLYVITGKEMNNNPNKMTGQLNVNSFYESPVLESSTRHYIIYKYVSSGEERPFIIPQYYPLQIFRHTIKAVLSLAVKTH